MFVFGDVTPLKTNMSPKKGHFKWKVSSLQTIMFQSWHPSPQSIEHVQYTYVKCLVCKNTVFQASKIRESTVSIFVAIYMTFEYPLFKSPWTSKQPCFNGCFTRMTPNRIKENWWKSPCPSIHSKIVCHSRLPQTLRSLSKLTQTHLLKTRYLQGEPRANRYQWSDMCAWWNYPLKSYK